MAALEFCILLFVVVKTSTLHVRVQRSSTAWVQRSSTEQKDLFTGAYLEEYRVQVSPPEMGTSSGHKCTT